MTAHASLQVGLPQSVIRDALERMTPIKIHLAPPEEERRWIELDPPRRVDFEPGLGIRIETTGRIKFDLGGVTIPAVLSHIEFLLMPKLIPIAGRPHRIGIPLEILKGDLKFIPDVIDDWIVAQVNQAITPRSSSLVWEFDDALSHEFSISERLQPLAAIGFQVVGGDVRVTEDELCFRIDYDITMDKKPSAGDHDVALEDPETADRRRHRDETTPRSLPEGQASTP